MEILKYDEFDLGTYFFFKTQVSWAILPCVKDINLYF